MRALVKHERYIRNRPAVGPTVVALLFLMAVGQVEDRSADGADKTPDLATLRVAVDLRPVAAWLDPAHDYMPRRIEMMQFPSGESPTLMHGFDVFEFRKFPDGAGGNEKWFPVIGRVKNWQPYLLQGIDYETRNVIDVRRRGRTRVQCLINRSSSGLFPVPWAL